MKTLAPLALLALACLLPAAQAQGSPTGVALVSAGPVPEVPYEGAGTIPFEATVGCGELFTSANAPLVVTVDPAPAWMAVTPYEEDVPADRCLTGGGSATVQGEVAFTVTKDAPGVKANEVTVVASVGSTGSAPTAVNVKVAYYSNYSIVPELTFPYTMTAPEVTFKVTATQASNARSMIMIEEVTTTGGTFAGLPSTVYEVEAGKPDTKTFDVTFKAPTGEWTSAKVSFKAFGHFLLLDGESGDYSPAQEHSWEFVNGGVEPADDGGDKGKESSAPVAALTALGLLGFAAARRRKA